jgi:starvation-inducible DNA-binding protein
MDALAERVQGFGGVALALEQAIVEETRLARAPRGIESPVNQLQRLVSAHEFILMEARPLAAAATGPGDDSTADLIVSQVIRCDEQESWFVSRHIHWRAAH